MLGAFRNVTLRELNRRERLAAVCHACGHRSNIVPADIPAAISRDIQLAAMEKQLRCRRCGQRGRASITVFSVRG